MCVIVLAQSVDGPFVLEKIIVMDGTERRDICIGNGSVYYRVNTKSVGGGAFVMENVQTVKSCLTNSTYQ